MSSYLSPEEYSGNIPAEELEKRLNDASRDIDALTFDRIREKGFEALTEFQQGLIKEAAELHADFCYENAELLEGLLAAYSVNGVSMSFDRSKIVTVGGTTTTSRVYNLLMQTGLCCRRLI